MSLTSSEAKDTLIAMNSRSSKDNKDKMDNTKENTPEDMPVTVTLPSPFGLRPGIYLSVLYGILLLLLFLFIFFLPGLRNPGERVTIRSIPSGAAVFINDHYYGTSPLEAHVSKGEAQIRLEKSGYHFEDREIQLGNRLFASRFFPKQREIVVDYSDFDVEKRFAELFKEVSAYSLVDTYLENYQAPPLISNLAQEMVEIGTMAETAMYDKLFMLTPLLGNPTIFQDLYNGYTIIRGDGFSEKSDEESPDQDVSELIANLADASGLSRDHIRLAAGIDDKGSEVREGEQHMPWEKATALQSPSRFQPDQLSGPFSFGDIQFIPLQGGEISIGDALQGEQIESCYIADREITVGLYRDFLEESPEWREENKETLISKGLADKEYLSHWAAGEWAAGNDGGSGSESGSGTAADTTPISGISYYAAEAFCVWLDAKLSAANLLPSPATLGEGEEWRVRLPSEAEWELARLRNGESATVFNEKTGRALPVRFDRKGKIGVYDLEGNLWEWTGDWFFPLSRLYRYEGIEIVIPEGAEGAERIVKGGSWANRRELIPWWSTGKQPPSWSSPFLGFRPVIAKSRIQADGR